MPISFLDGFVTVVPHPFVNCQIRNISPGTIGTEGMPENVPPLDDSPFRVLERGLEVMGRLVLGHLCGPVLACPTSRDVRRHHESEDASRMTLQPFANDPFQPFVQRNLADRGSVFAAPFSTSYCDRPVVKIPVLDFAFENFRPTRASVSGHCDCGTDEYVSGRNKGIRYEFVDLGFIEKQPVPVRRLFCVVRAATFDNVLNLSPGHKWQRLVRERELCRLRRAVDCDIPLFNCDFPNLIERHQFLFDRSRRNGLAFPSLLFRSLVRVPLERFGRNFIDRGFTTD